MNIPQVHTDPNEIVFLNRDKVLSVFLGLGKECGGLYVYLQLGFAPTETCVDHSTVGKSEWGFLRGVSCFSLSEAATRSALTALHEAEILCVESRYRHRLPIPPSLRRKVFERDKRQCVFCHSTENLELDHIKRYCDGGLALEQNLRVLCRKCNKSRGRKVVGA